MHLFILLSLASAVVASSPTLSPLELSTIFDPYSFPTPVPVTPKNATGVTTITSPGGASIRYKQPEKEAACETTPGVNTYSGYVDLDNSTHMFFWFVESRNDPATSPLTLWLNGGPGSDSLIGFFQELGPCNVTEDLKTQLNPYAWNEVSNMFFLSQPIGVGFSYSSEEISDYGASPTIDDSVAVGTTDLAAIGAWHVLQGFLANLPTLDSKISVKKFNLWTESYGGHYGPSFFSHFSDQNAAILNGTSKGIPLIMDTLGIINGLIDEKIQAPFYPTFAVNNTYGIQAVSPSIAASMTAAFYDPGMCSDQIDSCTASNQSTTLGMEICANASNTCRGQVEGPYYQFSGRGTYDIRHPADDPTPPGYFVDYLNLASTQEALGVNLNYTSDSSDDVYDDFEATGDFIYRNFVADLEGLLDSGVRVALFYGDADYICNWFGGEAISLQLNYTHSTQFRSVPYSNFTVNDTSYGQVRQYGNFSFTRIYESGHEIPYYQPIAALEFFRRTLAGKAIADGVEDVASVTATGSATATTTGSVTGSGGAKATGTSTGTGTGGAASPTSSKSAAGGRRVSMFWRRRW